MLHPVNFSNGWPTKNVLLRLSQLTLNNQKNKFFENYDYGKNQGLLNRSCEVLAHVLNYVKFKGLSLRRCIKYKCM